MISLKIRNIKSYTNFLIILNRFIALIQSFRQLIRHTKLRKLIKGFNRLPRLQITWKLNFGRNVNIRQLQIILLLLSIILNNCKIRIGSLELNLSGLIWYYINFPVNDAYLWLWLLISECRGVHLAYANMSLAFSLFIPYIINF